MLVELAELKALQFAGGGLGNFGEELDPAGLFVASQSFGDPVLEFSGQLGVRFTVGVRYDVGSGLG